MANQDTNGQTLCPKCESKNWSCWDEQVEHFYDPDDKDSDFEYFEFPVGYMKCNDCGTTYLSYPDFGENVEYIGSTHELNKELYGDDYDG